jgi:hypothetical protein
MKKNVVVVLDADLLVCLFVLYVTMLSVVLGV